MLSLSLTANELEIFFFYQGVLTTLSFCFTERDLKHILS